jgi:hypothetical protein
LKNFLKIYFYRQPTSGSFVKPNKVEFGHEIFNAVIEKYLDNDDDKPKANDKNADEYLYDSSRL